MAAVTWLRRLLVTAIVLVGVMTSVQAKCSSTGTNCVRSCANQPNGDYQSCDGCDVYVTCSNGFTYNNRPCPSKIVWNDNIKACDWTSPTCVCLKDSPGGLVINGQWSEWDPWSSCSVTCDGGTQQRVRRCDDPTPENGGSECVGVSSESRPCDQWACPDCSRTCPPGGHLDPDCSVCQCDGDVIEGRVTDRRTSLPLADVNIFTVGREWSAAAVSGRDGRFTLSGVCVSGLRLTARKDGYESATQEYVVTVGSSVNVVMYRLEKPTFYREPTSTAGFVGGKVRFICLATADPDVTQYDWFKDGHIIRSDVVGGSGNSGSVYEVASVKPDDVGQYVCRAVSLGGKIFSRVASLVVKDASATDTCDKTPLDLSITLPPTCKVTIDGTKVTSVNVGRCSHVPCVTRTSSDSEGLCCVPSSTRQLKVKCDGFSYDVHQVASCECARCDDNKKVTVTGRASSAGADVTDVHVLYDDVAYDVTKSQFLFEATPRAGVIVFQVKSSAFMPRLVTLDVSEGVAQVYVDVSLVARPSPEVVDAATGAQLQVVTPGMSSAVSVTIPPAAFQDKNGDPVSGDVNVFLSISDPRLPDGLDSASGQFTFQDSEGETRLLKTFGVVTLLAEDTNGNEVYLSGKATMTLNTDAMGLAVGESVALWVIDGASGTWRKTVDMMTGSRRRRRRQASMGSTLTGQTEIPREVPVVNCDTPIPRRQLLCSVAVYVYYGNDFSVPMPGERVTATGFDSETGAASFQLTATTDQNGRACVVVACNTKYQLKMLSSGGIIVHPTHSLPVGFPFANVFNGVTFTTTPPKNQADSANGPVFFNQQFSFACPATPQFFFKFALEPIRPALYGSLNAGPGWYPDPPAEAPACAYLVVLNLLNSSEASKMKLVGTSSDPQGLVYGTFTTPVIFNPDQTEFSSHRACVLARCPTADVDHTVLDIHIAYDKRSQCRLGHQFNGTDGEATEILSTTSTSIKIKIKYSHLTNPVTACSDRNAGLGFHCAVGSRQAAFAGAMRRCDTDFNFVVQFNCQGEEASP